MPLHGRGATGVKTDTRVTSGHDFRLVMTTRTLTAKSVYKRMVVCCPSSPSILEEHLMYGRSTHHHTHHGVTGWVGSRVGMR